MRFKHWQCSECREDFYFKQEDEESRKGRITCPFCGRSEDMYNMGVEVLKEA